MKHADQSLDARDPKQVRDYNLAKLEHNISSKRYSDTKASEMVGSLKRALSSEKQLDVNDAGIGVVALQRGKFDRKKDKFSSYVMLEEAQKSLNNSKIASFYKGSST